MAGLLMIVLIIFSQIMFKYWRHRNHVVVEWMKNSKILQQIKAEMLTSQDKHVEGTLSVVPLYSCKMKGKRSNDQIVLLYRLDCYNQFSKYHETAKALILVDNDSGKSSQLRKEVKTNSFTSSYRNVILIPNEAGLKLIESFEPNNDLRFRFKCGYKIKSIK